MGPLVELSNSSAQTSVPDGMLGLNAWLEVLVRARIFERAEARDWAGVRRLLRNRVLLGATCGTVITAVIYFFGHWLAFKIIGAVAGFVLSIVLLQLVSLSAFLQIIVRGFWHPQGHLGEYYAAHGRADRAVVIGRPMIASTDFAALRRPSLP